MSILSQRKYQHQRMVKYAQKHSVTETAIRYKVSRKTVYKWLSRYNGTTMSLEDYSHRPKTSPRSHTQKELKQIRHRLKDAIGQIFCWLIRNWWKRMVIQGVMADSRGLRQS